MRVELTKNLDGSFLHSKWKSVGRRLYTTWSARTIRLPLAPFTLRRSFLSPSGMNGMAPHRDMAGNFT